MAPIRTTCAYCGVGCGISATPLEGRSAAIAGDKQHAANRGKLCSKGTHLGETTGLDGRLLHPMIGDRKVTWDRALDRIAGVFAKTIRKHGPDSIGFYVSGQLLTEDYYVANKLMKGFIGSSNIDTNSRLCMSSAVAAHLRAFGEDVVPACYEDIDEADLILLVGSNTAWCHPVIWQRIEAARTKRGSKLVVIDPRRTETAEQSDLHIALRPGSDITLFNGLLADMLVRNATDVDYVERSVEAPADFWAHVASEGAIDRVSQACDVPIPLLRKLFDLFAAHPRTLTLFSQGSNQSIQGTDNGNAIINLHLATGRIGKPGAGPFSITGQPNAMGGREVGGLATSLAAHMGFSQREIDRVGRFWNAPAMATGIGLKAVDMFDAVRAGRIKALWVMATNPAVSLPNAGRVREALAACPLVIVSDVMAETDTARFAHIKLPALAWGEKDGTVTNSERMISRQRAFLDAPGAAKPDWWIVCEVARRMGFADAFSFESAAAIFAEHARLTAYENDGERRLDLRDWIGDEYDGMEPRRWGGERPFSDGRFSTASGRARLIAVAQRALPADPAYPLILNTGRYRDHWHTMTRTGLSPRLSQHRREPLVEVHPLDAAESGLTEGDLARVSTAQGASIFRCTISEGQRPGELFVPIHWTDITASGGRTGVLPGSAVDPFSGQPGFKATPACLSRIEPEWRGFLVTRDAIAAPDCLWSTRIKVAGGWLWELAGYADAILETNGLLPEGARVESIDVRRGSTRVAILDEMGRLRCALYATREGTLPGRDWIVTQLMEPVAGSPMALLAGRPSEPMAEKGAIICACFDVGARTILAAIADQRLTTIEAIGTALRAGTNCGSCRPALARMLGPAKEVVRAAG